MLIATFSGQTKRQACFLNVCLLSLALHSGCSEHSTDAIPTEDQTKLEQTTATGSSASNDQDQTARKDENPVLQSFIDEIDLYHETLQTETDALKDRVTQFAVAPSEKTLHDSILAWEQAHNRYLAGHFLEQLLASMIISQAANQSDQPLLDVQKRLDAYPLLPGYLDAVEGYPFSGLIHTEMPLTLATLYQEFQLGDAAYVTLGFHALEVMLKGTDKERKMTEFEALKALQDTSKAAPELRRTLYCSLLAEQIQDDIQSLSTQWHQHIKTALFHLDAEQTNNMKLRLTKALRQQTIKIEEHQSQTAQDMEQTLREKILLSLEKTPSS